MFMRVFDFDKTIYDGDSTVDFYFYCLRKYPKTLLGIPSVFFRGTLFCLGIYEKTRFKEYFYRFLRRIPDVKSAVSDFWDTHESKIKSFYTAQPEDTIISASPEFLLKEICARLHINRLIASVVDEKTGIYTGKNCYGSEKVTRLNRYMQNYKIDEFYSDSLSDSPLAELAEKSYIVNGNTIIPWNEYKPSLLTRIKKTFFNKSFFIFLVIGVINTVNGILFSSLFSLFMQPNLAFVCGYILSLFISYLLNSAAAFKSTLSLKKAIKFFVSYIPNFIIQNLSVAVIYNIMKFPPITAYAAAAAIGIPITFILLKIFAFKK